MRLSLEPCVGSDFWPRFEPHSGGSALDSSARCWLARVEATREIVAFCARVKRRGREGYSKAAASTGIRPRIRPFGVLGETVSGFGRSMVFWRAMDGASSSELSIVQIGLETTELRVDDAGEHRLVVLPAFRGLGVGARVSDSIARLHFAHGALFYAKTAHPRLTQSRDASSAWRNKTSATRRKPKQDAATFLFVTLDTPAPFVGLI